MTTIRDLAKNWWDNLDHIVADNFIIQYNVTSNSDFKEIENIFFEEVIVKWWDSVEDKFTMLTKYSINSGLKEIYLKELTKEEQVEAVPDVVICVNCKSFHWNGIDECIVCSHTTFEKTHSSNHKYIVQSTEQPKEEVDVWNEAANKYFNSDGCNNNANELLRFFKKHYTLIKK